MTVTDVAPVETDWIPDADTFGARLILIRQRMGWGNVKEAAMQCGLPPESWRTWERDGVEPRRIVDISRQIAIRTGCSFGWLLTGSKGASIPTCAYGPGARDLAPRRHRTSRPTPAASRPPNASGPRRPTYARVFAA